MEGEDFSSTDLNLAAEDSLLVGQVADLTPVDGSESARASNIHHRKLQVRVCDVLEYNTNIQNAYTSED